ncbi:MAG: hypothetical protein ABI193_13655 [Minicystis sp.]
MSDEAPAEASREDADDEGEDEAVAAAPPPAKKKSTKAAELRKKRKPSRAGKGDADDEPARPAYRDDLPAFAQSFPHDPALDALVAAFEGGDYARVRREGPALAKSTERPEVRTAARELVKRLDPDPIAVYLLGTAALLLVFLAGWFWMHPHELP